MPTRRAAPPKTRRIPRGFNLVEFILYFALISIVMTAVVKFAADVAASRAKTVAVAEVEQNTRLVVMRVLRAVRQADKVNNGASTFDNDNGVLSLDQPATSTTPTIFDLSGGAVRMKEGAGAATALTSGQVQVTKLRFGKDNLGGNNVAITVEVAARYLTSNPAREYNYEFSASSSAVIRKQ